MLNRIFKTKFDPATGLSYAVSELSKSHLGKKLSLTTLGLSLLGALSLSNPAYAACTKDTSDPNTTVMHCSGEVDNSVFNGITTDKLKINSTGHINGYPSNEYSTLSTELISTGGKLSGNLTFGLSGDTVTLSDNTDTSDLKKLWGHQNNYNMPDYQAEKMNGIDVLNINQTIFASSFTSNNNDDMSIHNWHTINIGKDSAGKLTFTGTELIGDTNRSQKYTINIGSQGILSFMYKRREDLEYSGKFLYQDIFYNFVNEGSIYLSENISDPSYNRLVNIIGDYEGKQGSKIFVNTKWNNPDEQRTDVFVVSGRASGQSEVIVQGGIIGDITAGEVEKNGLFKSPVIIVANKRNYIDEDGNMVEELNTCQGEQCLNNPTIYTPLPEDYIDVFYGTAHTTNAGESQLKREGNRYFWTLKAKKTEQPKPSDTTTATTEDTSEYVDIINKPVTGYLQQPYVNQQMMLAQLGKLHERVGEQRYLSLNNAVAEKQLWARTNYDFTTLQGKERFGMDVKSGFIQVGKDLAFNLNQDKSQQHTGVMFTYGWAKSKFFDKFRAENGQVIADKYTGKAHTDMLSLGGYHTYYSANGFYVDTVAQLSWLQNRYNSFDTKVKQNGWGVGASIEIGKAFPLLNPKLAIEPQAQLTYQRIWLNGFNNGTREVKKGSQDNITARLGARLIWNESLENNASQLYFTANLIQTLKGRDSRITVGRENVSERYGDLSAEFGVGGQYPINPNLSLYADVRYVIGMQDHSQTHKNSQLSRQSYNGRIGLRYSF